MVVVNILASSDLPSRPLAVSSQVLSGSHENVPTFPELGVELADSYGAVYGIAVSPLTSESLRQEMALAFSNITSDQNFTNDIINLGGQILYGYSYNSPVMNNYINHVLGIINQVLAITTSSVSPTKTKLSTLAILLGVLIPLFVILLVIFIIFALYLKSRRIVRPNKIFELVSLPVHEIGKRRILESRIVKWSEVTDMKKIGSGA